MKRDNRANQVFTAADPYYYESIDRYEYDPGDFHDHVSAITGPGWEIIRHGVWLHCYPSSCGLPLQGWKIHLSARCKNALEILKRAAGVLVPRNVPFKFLLDKSVLAMTTSKSWSRGGAGKFITVYPSDEGQFAELLESLSRATAEFSGPYILSDRRYKNSKTVYYRYGGITPNSVLESDGQKMPVLVSPSGEKVPDIRQPYFSLPYWIKDIRAVGNGDGEGLNNGRYKVESSLGFSNSGGVYLAVDGKTGKKVIVKEARPLVNEFACDGDVISLLRKEHRILEKVKGMGIAPAPIDFFQEWEHAFLVQEYLDKYISLSKWGVKSDIVLRTRFARRDARTFFLEYAEIFGKLAAIIEKLHGQGIIFGDFSANNVMVAPDSLDVRLIDFEGAGEAGVKKPACFFTPGFSDPRRPCGAELSFADDYYAFGANMLNTLFRVNLMAGLAPEISGRWLDCLVAEFGFPCELRSTISGLMAPDPAARITPVKAVKTLKTALETMPNGVEIMNVNIRSKGAGHYHGLVSNIVKHIELTTDYRRKDRLWPSVPAMFKTNPLGVAYGAAGVLKVFKIVAPEKISAHMLEWVADRDIRAEDYPPGLYTGISGIAWTLLDLGLEQRASELFEMTVKHPLLHSGHDIFNGLAGWGMANLHFMQVLGERKYLDRAVDAGERLLLSALADNNGLYWGASQADIPVGFAFGSAGTALFLAYLGKASGRIDFSKAAVKALDFDLKRVIVTPDGGFCWPATTAPDKPMLPYLESGGAGMGMACLRFWKLTGDRRYLDIVERVYIDCDRIYTINPGRNNGLAGLGEFLLDAYRFTKDEKYKKAAYKTAAGIEKFAAISDTGAAFPGDGLARFSCDYASGSAGIAAFFHRLESGCAADYMLDHLL